MIGLHRLPIRLRLSLAFAGAMAILLGLVAMTLYARVGVALSEAIDSGLRARAETLETHVLREGSLAEPQQSLIESDEAFAQVIAADGAVRESSEGQGKPLFSPAFIRGISGPEFLERRVSGIGDVARLFIVPLSSPSGRLVVVVGSSMQDRAEALHQLTAFFAGGGPIALLLMSMVGWIVAGRALRPVENMRKQASAISHSELDRRLTTPSANDEIHRLADTLNDMLERLQETARRERRFLDDASHELRTPLTALKAELDLTASRPRSQTELSAALASASEETDRLARMAEDLLVLSRANAGNLPLHREHVSLRELVTTASRLFRARADAAGVRIDADAPEATAFIDGTRARQAIDNLLDNALRYSQRGTTVRLRGAVANGLIRIVVEDEGPGFPIGFEENAFEPFQRALGGSQDGAGLGLAIVRAIAESHDGSAAAENLPAGGARVVVVLKQPA
jgi:heavy metal sensor kinase